MTEQISSTHHDKPWICEISQSLRCTWKSIGTLAWSRHMPCMLYNDHCAPKVIQDKNRLYAVICLITVSNRMNKLPDDRWRFLKFEYRILMQHLLSFVIFKGNTDPISQQNLAHKHIYIYLCLCLCLYRSRRWQSLPEIIGSRELLSASSPCGAVFSDFDLVSILWCPLDAEVCFCPLAASSDFSKFVVAGRWVSGETGLLEFDAYCFCWCCVVWGLFDTAWTPFCLRDLRKSRLESDKAALISCWASRICNTITTFDCEHCINRMPGCRWQIIHKKVSLSTNEAVAYTEKPI